MKKWFFILCFFSLSSAFAQDQGDGEGRKGFNKENLFSGGSLSLSFFNNTFLIGGSPVLGYRLADWVDGGIVVNFQYSSQRDYLGGFNDKLRQTVYGGGVFTRLYPVPFLFGQAQAEHNFIAVKYIPANGGGTQKFNTSANALLVGAGYTQGRMRGVNSPFFYLSVLWDVSGNKNSPYTDAYGRSVPIIRAGFNVPLSGGRRRY